MSQERWSCLVTNRGVLDLGCAALLLELYPGQLSFQIAPVDEFSSSFSVLLASAFWYLIFSHPMNLFYKYVGFLSVKLIFVAMKEVVIVYA